MMKKRIMLIASTLVVTAFALTKLHTVTAYAVEGWMSEDGEWSYLDENDEPLQIRGDSQEIPGSIWATRGLC